MYRNLSVVMDIEQGMSGWKKVAGRLVEGVNVRRDEKDRHLWRPTGEPKQLRSDGWIPVVRVALSGASRGGRQAEAMFWSNGARLGVSVGGQGDDLISEADVSEVGSIGKPVLLIDVVEPGVLRCMLRHGRAVYLTYDRSGNVAFHGEMPTLPDLWLSVVDEVSLSEPLPDIRLSGESGARGAGLTVTDCRLVTKAFVDAYERLKGRALSLGYMLQPVLARYRVEDGAGDTVVLSAMIMAGSASGFQCCEPVVMNSNDGLCTLSGGSLTARCYRLRLNVPEALAEPWASMLKAVSVELTGEIDPIESGRLCQVAVSVDGQVATVSVGLPGLSGTNSATMARLKILAEKAIACSGQSFGVHGRFGYPFSSGFTGAEIVPVGEAAPAPLVAGSPLRDGVSYSSGCVAGGLTVVANERREGFAGYGMLQMMLGNTNTERWQGRISVKLRRCGGAVEVATRVFGGETGCPSGLSPLLVYPDADAEEMTVTISRGSGIVTETYRLISLPDVGISYYLSPTLRQTMPSQEAEQFPIEVSSVGATERPGYVGIFNRGMMNAPLDVRRCTDSEIQFLLEAPRSRGAWDYSRERVMAYGRFGSAVITIDSNRRLHSVSMLDNRRVESVASVGTGTRGLVHLVVGGGDLLEIDQNGVSTLLRCCKGLRAVRCEGHDEAWLSGGDGELRRLTSDGELIGVAFGGILGRVEVMEVDGRRLMACDSGLYDLEQEAWPTGGVAWRLAERFDMAVAQQVELSLFASELSGKIVLKGDNGSRIGEPLLELQISGSLNAPLPVRLVGPHRRFMECELDLRSGQDGEWDERIGIKK